MTVVTTVIKVMKNTVIGNLVKLDAKAKKGDSTRIKDKAINKAEVLKANKATADLKEESAGRKYDHYQKVLEKIDITGLTH